MKVLIVKGTNTEVQNNSGKKDKVKIYVRKVHRKWYNEY